MTGHTGTSGLTDRARRRLGHGVGPRRHDPAHGGGGPAFCCSTCASCGLRRRPPPTWRRSRPRQQWPAHVDPCAAAREVAEAQEAVLVACSVDGPVVDVVVARTWPGRLAVFPEVRVRARAGPPGAR